MALPIVAVVGRPNVGKSTFVNRITQQSDAIVHEARGVTRDRSYHRADWNGVYFLLIDTGGIEAGNVDEFQSSIRTQAIMAAEEADAIVFLVDGKTGLSADDEQVAKILKRQDKPVFLAVNKVDTPGSETETYEFWSLGLGTPWPVSATHGNGTGDLLDEIVKVLPESEPEVDTGTIDVAIIGRPNAGSFVRAMRAIDRAQVVLLVIDSSIGLTDQDQRIARFAEERGCAMIVLLNKWDLLEDDEAKDLLLTRIEERLGFVGYAPVIRISALSGRGVHRIWDQVDKVFASYVQEISTSALNKLLTEMRDFGHTVNRGGATLRMHYVTQTRTAPPGFTFFANHPSMVEDNFRRYVENRLRERFDFTGTPIFLKFRKKD